MNNKIIYMCVCVWVWMYGGMLFYKTVQVQRLDFIRVVFDLNTKYFACYNNIFTCLKLTINFIHNR